MRRVNRVLGLGRTRALASEGGNPLAGEMRLGETPGPLPYGRGSVRVGGSGITVGCGSVTGGRGGITVGRGDIAVACVGLVALGVAAVALKAQQDAPTLFRSETRVVVCNTTVVDKNGLSHRHGRGRFAVFENGVAQDRGIQHEDVPVSLGTVIDNSGSMRTKRAGVEAASLALVRDSNPEDEVFVVNFNDEPFLDLPNKKNFTNTIREMEEALTRIDSKGGTAMRDAILHHQPVAGERESRKKVLVLVTEQVDNASMIKQTN